MSEENLLFEMKEHTEIITLNRAKALNALNMKIVAELGQAVADAQTKDDIKAIIITGAGRAFAAGADIAGFAEKSAEEMRILSKKGHEDLGKIRNSTKPVIAAVNGMALGGGLELAMSCHIRIAADTAILGLPEVGLGSIPGYGGTQLLPRLIGKGSALYYLLTTESINASEAYRLGLVDKLVPADKLMITALAVAKVIGQKGPVAIRLVMEGVNKGMELSLDKALELEEDLQRKVAASEDFQAGVKAFMGKRPVVFKGR